MKRNRTTFCNQITGSISTEAFTDVIGEPHKIKGLSVLYDLENAMENVKILDCRNGVGDNEFHVKIQADKEVHTERIAVLKNSKDNEGYKLKVSELDNVELLELKIGKHVI